MLLNPGGEYDYNGRRRSYPDTRLVYWCGGNPFHHHQDLTRLARAWQRPETVIVHEPFWNPIARFADIVFPVATSLERDDFAAGSYDLWISSIRRAADPPPGVRTDFEIFCALADRLGFGEGFSEGRTAEEWVALLYDNTRGSLAREGVELPDLDGLFARGQVRTGALPGRIAGDFAALRADPMANALDTPSGKIEIFSDRIAGFDYEDCPPHPKWLEPIEWLGAQAANSFPLHLLSPQPTTRLHSQYDHGSHSQASKIGGREPIMMHPADASERDIADGDIVRVYNDRGACLAGAVLSEDLRPGVVCLPTGAWFDPGSDEWEGLELHGNPNVLTPDRGTSCLAQGPSAQSALVEIERFSGTPPPVRAFVPPQIRTYRADTVP